MHFSDIQIVLQEVPGEVSICFTITGCDLRCDGCHSPFIWKKKSGTELTKEKYLEVLNLYKGFASCVLFMGGEWHGEELIHNLETAKLMGYSTCLYTGLEEVDPLIYSQLTWLKTGSWKKDLGGLENELTNQVFKEVKNNKVLNHLFK